MRHTRRLLGLFGAVALGLAGTIGTPAPARGEATFELLGRLPGDLVSEAYGVSADGSVVVGLSNVRETPRAFRWTRATGMQPLTTPVLPAISYALSVSPDGSTAVGVTNNGPGTLEQALRWPAAGGMIPLGTLPFNMATGVSRNGSVIVGEGQGVRGIEAFRWTESEGMVGLGFLNPGAQFPQSGASDVSADGRFVVGSSVGGDGSYQAYRWSRETGMVALSGAPEGAVYSTASAVSHDGKVVVGAITTGTGRPNEAFRWTEEAGMKLLRETTPDAKEHAMDVSGDGRIVVGIAAFGAFMWDAEHGIRQLDVVLREDYGLEEALRGWTLNSALAISDDGRAIVGSGIDPSGQEYACLVALPEPSSAAVVILATCLIVLPRRVRAHRR